MSHRQKNKNLKNLEKTLEKCQLNDDILISYSIEMLEMMKKGYKDMGDINLQYANEASTSDYKDNVYYEMWLCGV
ncbi:hypothetical protein [uncultured Clostridium sp.]|jgi:hypothetical protein|uniref:hypothetical protein n=1 Tax=uncultured Clostridium sp. TaxID=59620 RepID=UPI002620FA94|nr:hypothetical protein [uncultured Clostridium sp.]